MRDIDLIDDNVTDKSLYELDYLAVQAPSSETIHVMKTADHMGWAQGDSGKSVCGRTLPELWILDGLSQEDKPCKLCERSAGVIAIMFETVAAIGKVIAEAEADNERMAFMSWITHGMHFGYISPPFCGQHTEGVPPTPEEQEMQEQGEDPCIYVIRLYNPGGIMFQADEIP